MEALPSFVSPPPPSLALARGSRCAAAAAAVLPRPRRAPANRRRLPALCAFDLHPAPFLGGGLRRRRRGVGASASSSPSTGGGDERGADGDLGEEVERALGMDGSIPGSSQEFVRRVSSRAYDMRRNLMESIDSASYDVVETNPWREDSKPVYVLTQRDNQIWTMKTRQSRSEVEKELGVLFSKRLGSKSRKPNFGAKFQMLVEDIREGVLVFEDEHEATRYCDLLQGGGQGCEGIAEIEASSVFDICHKMRALAVLFRRGRTPPLPKSLEQNLRAKKRSLEDQDHM